MFERILVAADGSEHARKAARIAGSLAGRYDAELIIAHVLTGQPVPEALHHMAEAEHLVQPQGGGPSQLGRLSIETRSKAEEERLAAAIGTKILEQSASLARQEGARRITPIELSGHAADALLGAARDCGADLVVCGSRGFGAVGSVVMGSVSSRLAHHLEVPCLTVK